MKNVIIIICLLVAIIFFIEKNTGDSNFKSLKREVDSIKKVTYLINHKVDTIQYNIDTLKKGQVIIYNEVKKTQNKTFWDFF